MRDPLRSKGITTYEQISLIIGSLDLVASYVGLALIYYGIRELSLENQPL